MTTAPTDTTVNTAAGASAGELASILDQVRGSRAVADDAELAVFLCAVAWAHAHPVLDDERAWGVRFPETWLTGGLCSSTTDLDPEQVEWVGIPTVRWDAVASFAAANAMSTSAGQCLIRDALVLRHRMPRTWDRLLHGGIAVWRARRVAQALLGRPADVVAALDAHVAPVLGTLGPVTLDRLVREELMRLHAEELELQRLEDLDARHVRFRPESIGHTGVTDMEIRGDFKDLHDFDTTLSDLAAALADQGCQETLDVRRSMAVGVLADPAHAATLLNHEPHTPHSTEPGPLDEDEPHWDDPDENETDDGWEPDPDAPTCAPRPDAEATDPPAEPPTDQPPERTRPPRPTQNRRRRRRRGRRGVMLHIHTTRAALAGHDTVARNATTGLPVLLQEVADWCGRPDTDIYLRGVIDLAEHTHLEAYEIPDRLKDQTGYLHPTCVFPWCRRPALDCDCDHTHPYSQGGPTCIHNLAPLCRTHHQLKTHTTWTYRVLDPHTDPDTYLWTDPHTAHYLRTPTGTTYLPPP